MAIPFFLFVRNTSPFLKVFWLNILPPFSVSAVGRMIKEHDNLFLKSHQKCKYITSERNQIHLADTMSGLYQIMKMFVFLNMFLCHFFVAFLFAFCCFKIKFFTYFKFIQQKSPSSNAWPPKTQNQVFLLCWTSLTQITSSAAPTKEEKLI